MLLRRGALVVLAALALAAQVAAVRDPGFRVHAPTNAEHNHEKVQVYYYMESLCPDCAKFGAGALSDAVDKLSDLMDLYVVAYGNERYNETTDKYTCQHGPEECYMNLVENCLDFYSNDDYRNYYPFFKCADEIAASVFPNVDGVSAKIMAKCGSTLPGNLTPQDLDACAKDSLGETLIAISKYNTDTLDPPHTYVPWVVVDKKPIHLTFNNISAIVCDEWSRLNDASPPAQCSQFFEASEAVEEAGVCYL